MIAYFLSPKKRKRKKRCAYQLSKKSGLDGFYLNATGKPIKSNQLSGTGLVTPNFQFSCSIFFKCYVSSCKILFLWWCIFCARRGTRYVMYIVWFTEIDWDWNWNWNIKYLFSSRTISKLKSEYCTSILVHMYEAGEPSLRAWVKTWIFFKLD